MTYIPTSDFFAIVSRGQSADRKDKLRVKLSLAIAAEENQELLQQVAVLEEQVAVLEEQVAVLEDQASGS